jgi:hypothetical protein
MRYYPCSHAQEASPEIAEMHGADDWHRHPTVHLDDWHPELQYCMAMKTAVLQTANRAVGFGAWTIHGVCLTCPATEPSEVSYGHVERH